MDNLKFLKKYNISDEEIESLKESYDENVLESIDEYSAQCILNYLQEYGFEDLYYIIYKEIEILFENIENIKKRISFYERLYQDKKRIISLLEEDTEKLINDDR